MRARTGLRSFDKHPIIVLACVFAQGPVCGAVSCGPYDGIEEEYEGRGVLQAVESADQLLSEILLGKDPKQQAKIDKLLTQESLPGNVVSAASIACCKAGAKQAFVSVFDHVSTMCNNSEGGIPPTAFSIINGGQSAASSLWIQVIQGIVLTVAECFHNDTYFYSSHDSKV